jgi:AraC-like DNA-binding protein
VNPQGLTRLQKIDTTRISGRVRPRVKPRGLPPALEGHLLWSTRDVRAAERSVAALLGHNAIRITDRRPSDFHASLHAVRLRDVTLGYLDFGCEIRLDVRELPDAFFVLVPMSGHSVVRTMGGTRPWEEKPVQATPIHGVVPAAGQAMTVECNRQAPHLVVVIEHQALLVHLSRILGKALSEPLVFDLGFDLSAPSASRWNFAIQMLHAELFERGSLLDRGVGLGQLEEFAMSSLLYAHRSNYSDALARPGQAHEHRTTRAAKDFVEQHLAEPLTVQAIASAAGVSIRTLQARFQAELATTPMTYVRTRRLERARADLADAGASEATTVTDVAERWGFTHLGRFAVDYKQRFGESPSDTLRR